MSAADTEIVELRLRRVRALLTALPCVAQVAERTGISIGSVCQDIELMAHEELTRVVAVLGTDVLNREC